MLVVSGPAEQIFFDLDGQAVKPCRVGQNRNGSGRDLRSDPVTTQSEYALGVSHSANGCLMRAPVALR